MLLQICSADICEEVACGKPKGTSAQGAILWWIVEILKVKMVDSMLIPCLPVASQTGYFRIILRWSQTTGLRQGWGNKTKENGNYFPQPRLCPFVCDHQSVIETSLFWWHQSIFIRLSVRKVERGKGSVRPALNSGFHSMKWLGILLLPPGWDATPSQGTQHDATRSITTPPDGMLVYHRVLTIKRPGIFLLPPGWAATPSLGTQHEATRNVSTPPWMGC